MGSFSVDFSELEKKINYKFQDKRLLAQAIIHRSFWNEHRQQVEGHNERLEFLGDSVLGLIVAEYLYKHLPDYPEGQLSDLRSQLVQSQGCAQYIAKLGIGHSLLLGKGEQMNEGRGRETILADFFEALMGAIYLDGGLEIVKHFFLSHFQDEINAHLLQPARNWKAELQDWAQKKYQVTPVYRVLKEEGLSHQKHYFVGVYIDEKLMGEGGGSSKKSAQAEAAKNALEGILS